MAITPITRDELASAWQRVAAVIVDGFLLCIGAMALVLLGAALGVGLGIDWSFVRNQRLWVSVLVSVLFAAYEIVGVAVWGQTLGKLFVGIRVCSVRDRQRPGWVRAIKRWGIVFVAGLVPYIGGLLALAVMLPVLWTTNRQGLHDKFADTLVVRNGVTSRP